jgi:hypothetical protein
MSPNAYKDAKNINLQEYLLPNYFRTVMANQLNLSHANTEIAVEIEVSKSFASKLKNDVPYGGLIRGFIHDNSAISDIFTGDMAIVYDKRHIGLYDWGNKFLLLFENGINTSEVAFFVSSKDVKFLLDNCRFAKEV